MELTANNSSKEELDSSNLHVPSTLYVLSNH